MAEFDPAVVQLVTVNLEEPADHVRGVMERHNLRDAVALDVDGVAARRYHHRSQGGIVDQFGSTERAALLKALAALDVEPWILSSPRSSSFQFRLPVGGCIK